MVEPTVIAELVCGKCGHHWIPRTPRLPKVCPKCKHYDWNKSAWEVENEVKDEAKIESKDNE